MGCLAEWKIQCLGWASNQPSTQLPIWQYHSQCKYQWVGFAFSKWPHFHNVYLLRGLHVLFSIVAGNFFKKLITTSENPFWFECLRTSTTQNPLPVQTLYWKYYYRKGGNLSNFKVYFITDLNRSVRTK